MLAQAFGTRPCPEAPLGPWSGGHWRPAISYSSTDGGRRPARWASPSGRRWQLSCGCQWEVPPAGPASGSRGASSRQDRWWARPHPTSRSPLRVHRWPSAWSGRPKGRSPNRAGCRRRCWQPFEAQWPPKAIGPPLGPTCDGCMVVCTGGCPLQCGRCRGRFCRLVCKGAHRCPAAAGFGDMNGSSEAHPPWSGALLAPPPLAEPPAPPSGAGTESDDDWARLLGFLSKGESLEWLGPVPTDEDHEVSEFAWNTEAGRSTAKWQGPQASRSRPTWTSAVRHPGPGGGSRRRPRPRLRAEADVTISEELSTSSASARCGRRWPEGGGWNWGHRMQRLSGPTFDRIRSPQSGRNPGQLLIG